MNIKNDILCILSVALRKSPGWEKVDFEKISEIRMRSGKPLIINFGTEEAYFSDNTGLCHEERKARLIKLSEIKETMEYITNYSIYAYEEELRQGYITIRGGHRIGICGKTITENDRVINLRNISSLNIRVSHQIMGCGNEVVGKLYDSEGRFFNTLIISPPGYGKTTLLRDLIRLVSDGNGNHAGLNVGVVDERAEIAAEYLGCFQNDIGMRSDVLECCPKNAGMLMLLRSMSPSVIAVDELGTDEDFGAACKIVSCGVRLIATVHGDSIKDINEELRKNIFKRFICLNKCNGQITADIYEENGRLLWEGGI